jgi:hypothetical protein
LKAKFSGICNICKQHFAQKTLIERHGTKWKHQNCGKPDSTNQTPQNVRLDSTYRSMTPQQQQARDTHSTQMGQQGKPPQPINTWLTQNRKLPTGN